jgi:dolichol kinase
MTSTLLLESRDLTKELYQLLRTLDPARWRREFEQETKERIVRLRERVTHLLDAEWPSPDATFAQLRERLTNLGQALQETLQQLDEGDARWNELRQRLVPAYEAMAASLKVQSIHVPSLRPTNYTRNLFHVSCGVVVLGLIQHTFSLETLTWLGLVAALMAWSMELGRRYSPRLNDLLMGLFGKVAHPHERHRVNSSTWYTTALFLLSWLMSPLAGSLAVVVLAVSDPMAAVVGRRFGKHQIKAGRTLEGSLAFVASGVLASLGVMALYYPTLSLPQMLLIALFGAVPGAIVEVSSERVDDNFSIPMTVACGTTVACWVLGIAGV